MPESHPNTYPQPIYLVNNTVLTKAEAFLATLMGSPLLVMGISALSMMYRQASRIPKLN